jgi:hypothetical protein
MAPEKSTKSGSLFSEASIPLETAFMLFQGVLIVVIGLSIYGIVLSGGALAFNSSGQGGLLLVILSLNVLALGSIVGLQLTRTWILMIIGTAFAALGMIAVISPSGVVGAATILLLGLSNIVTGILGVAGTLAAVMHGASSLQSEPDPVRPLLTRITRIALLIAIASILFGLSMLAPTLMPSILGLVGYAVVFPLILIIMGLLLLYMTRINLMLRQLS